jgi:hypothetical protein
MALGGANFPGPGLPISGRVLKWPGSLYKVRGLQQGQPLTV